MKLWDNRAKPMAGRLFQLQGLEHFAKLSNTSLQGSVFFGLSPSGPCGVQALQKPSQEEFNLALGV